METRDEREQSQKGGELKKRLQSVRMRKSAQSRASYDATAFKLRLARAKGHPEH